MFPKTLPVELTLQILSYLDLSTLSIVSSLDKSWHHLMQANESAIYHSAAFLEGYIPASNWTLNECRTREIYPDKIWLGVTNWKEFCQRRRQIENSWAGKGPSSIIRYQQNPESEESQRVHRIKVDEKAGYLITTSQLGGLVVTDIEKDTVLWSLPFWSVRAYAHLEYEQGYAIFDRLDGNKEVWRRTVDIAPDYSATALSNPGSVMEGYDQNSRPDERQTTLRTHVNFKYPVTGKGHFSPWALLHMPEPSRAYRFVYPNLLVSSKERVYIWDVRTAQIVQVIEGIQPINPPAEAEVAHAAHLQNSMQNGAQDDHEEDDDDDAWEDLHEGQQGADSNDDEDEPMPEFLGTVVYVEISSRHVFLAGRYVLRIFSRATGKCILNIPSTRTRYGFWKWDRTGRFNSNHEDTRCDPYRDAKSEGRELVDVPLHPSAGPAQVTRANRNQIIDSFTAVHVSEDGKHIVALLSSSRLLILPHFESIVAHFSKDGAKPLHNLELDQALYFNTLDIQLLPPGDSRSIYLAVGNGRIVAITTLGVFVVVPNIPSRAIIHPVPPFSLHPPSISFKRIPYFCNSSWLDATSCLMLCDTRLFLTYDPSPSETLRTLLREGNEGEQSEDPLLQAVLMHEEYLQQVIDTYLDDQDGYGQYHYLPNGDRVVLSMQFAAEISDKSVVFGVDFAPTCRSPSDPTLSPNIAQL